MCFCYYDDGSDYSIKPEALGRVDKLSYPKEFRSAAQWNESLKSRYIYKNGLLKVTLAE